MAYCGWERDKGVLPLEDVQIAAADLLDTTPILTFPAGVEPRLLVSNPTTPASITFPSLLVLACMELSSFQQPGPLHGLCCTEGGTRPNPALRTLSCYRPS